MKQRGRFFSSVKNVTGRTVPLSHGTRLENCNCKENEEEKSHGIRQA